MYVSAIVLAAGRSQRFKSKISKPLAEFNAKPVIIHCLDILAKHPYIQDIVLVVNRKNLKEITNKIRQYKIKKLKGLVLGGRRRQDSVMNGLKAIDKRSDLVLVHDGVRPFIDKATLSSVIKEAERAGAAIVGVPVKATIKKIKNQKPKTKNQKSFLVEKTFHRDNLWEIQTPQVFKKDLILEAYKKFGNTEVTDDASLVERLGRKVKIVRGSYLNIKITTPEDLIFAEAIAKKCKAA